MMMRHIDPVDISLMITERRRVTLQEFFPLYAFSLLMKEIQSFMPKCTRSILLSRRPVDKPVELALVHCSSIRVGGPDEMQILNNHLLYLVLVLCDTEIIKLILKIDTL